MLWSQAQQRTNLLNDPSFEGETWGTVLVSPDNNAFFNVPLGWGGGAYTQDVGIAWLNVYVNAYPHKGDYRVREGDTSLHVSRGGGQFTAWAFQTVLTVPNTPLEGGAYAFIDHANSAGYVRVGIDPSGNTNPYSSTVIWGEVYALQQEWVRPTVTTMATGTRATLFLFASQHSPADPNSVYWDGAFLFGESRQVVMIAPPTTSPNNAPSLIPTKNGCPLRQRDCNKYPIREDK